MKTRLPKPSEPCLVVMNGRTYRWEPVEGLDPAVALEVEGFIRKKAWGYRGWADKAGIEVDDLIQEGYAGAIKAAARFNPDAGANYLTYAAWWIDAAMKDATNHRLVRTPEGAAHAWIGSLDAPLGADGDENATTFLDLEIDDQPGADELAAAAEEQTWVHAALPKVESRSREVLVRHMGLDGDEPQPLKLIAKGLGVTRQRVGQILDGAKNQMRLALAG